MPRKEIMIESGKRIRGCRIRKGLSQEDLVQALNSSLKIDRTEISKIENGTRPLSVARADAFAEVLGVRSQYLLVEDQFMTLREWFDDKMKKIHVSQDFNRRRLQFWDLLQSHHYHVLDIDPDKLIVFKVLHGLDRRYYSVPKSYVEDMFDRLEFNTENVFNIDQEFKWMVERKGFEISEEDVKEKIQNRFPK